MTRSHQSEHIHSFVTKVNDERVVCHSRSLVHSGGTQKVVQKVVLGHFFQKKKRWGDFGTKKVVFSGFWGQFLDKRMNEKKGRLLEVNEVIRDRVLHALDNMHSILFWLRLGLLPFSSLYFCFLFVCVLAYPPLLGLFSHAAALLHHLVALR